jgi:hypothetical protein
VIATRSRARRHRPLSRRAYAVTVAALVASGVGVGQALASWTAHGTGGGHAATGTVTLSQTLAPATGLVPGGSATLTGTLRSAGAQVQVISIAPVASVDVGHTACNPATYLSLSPATALPVTVTTTATSAIAVTATLATSAPDACQGASFTVTATVTGRSA